MNKEQLDVAELKLSAFRIALQVPDNQKKFPYGQSQMPLSEKTTKAILDDAKVIYEWLSEDQ